MLLQFQVYFVSAVTLRVAESPGFCIVFQERNHNPQTKGNALQAKIRRFDLNNEEAGQEWVETTTIL